MTDQKHYSQQPSLSFRAHRLRPLWQYYLGVTALVLVMVGALAGGIISYNAKKSN